MTNNPVYYAHSENTVGDKHRLVDHLNSVARLASQFARACGQEQEACLAGVLHDLGKYGDRFQNRLLGEDHGLDHWSLGAHLAVYQYRSVAAALAIQGHHVGLQHLAVQDIRAIHPDKLATHHPQQLALSEADSGVLQARLNADGIIPKQPDKPVLRAELKSGFDTMLDIRLLFSALVDADFIDTEAHFQGGKEGKRYRPTGPVLCAESALKKIKAHIEHLSSISGADSSVSDVRRTLYTHSLRAAELSKGLFTMTAPTGSGKTLSMLAFALAHARQHGLRRIILVVPYLSIIEQTASIYKQLLGDDWLLEHHSLAGLGVECHKHDDEGGSGVSGERRRRMMAENWDSPVIITTSVQMLESLFSNRPSACRKLHQLPGSVILFDEVQTLPVGLVLPTLATLSHLAHQYGSSIVFATATQPAFDHLHDQVSTLVPTGWQPRSIVPHPEQLFTPLRRVLRYWGDTKTPLSWEQLSDQLRATRQVLCILNLKRHAKIVWETLNDEDTFHLSTNLCASHRQRILNEVRRRLRADEPVRLIATQCVEAGVDIDFPVVYRAYGPLDAIIQAEGRCNREGKRASKGEMRIFLPEDEGYPGGGYEQATDLTKIRLNRLGNEGMDLNDPETISSYYRELYDVVKPENVRKTASLIEHVKAGSFPDVAKTYRLIEHDTINVVVPYQDEIPLFDSITELASESGLTGELMRLARPITVGVFRPKPDDPLWDSVLEIQSFKQGKRSRQESWYLAARREHYHQHLGYQPPSEMSVWIG
ncbi:MAG: CRISPR-associated helicase Cas3' [Methylococcaceae bacterium]